MNTQRRSSSQTSRKISRKNSNRKSALRRFSLPEMLEARMMLSGTTFTVTNNHDSGAGSLRDAINSLNLDSDPTATDVINFQMDTLSSTTISLASALPNITHQVTIKGIDLTNHTKIQLDGSSLSDPDNGLTIDASNVTVQNLSIGGFLGSGILLEGAGGDTLQFNYIGVDATGTNQTLNGTGITIMAGGNLVDSNVVAGNENAGVDVFGSNNTLTGNSIGVDAAGNPLGNGIGLEIFGTQATDEASNNMVSGNTISANFAAGVSFEFASFNIVKGNFIGTDATGNGQADSDGNSVFGNSGIGVLLQNGSHDNLVGGPGASDGNFISGSQEGVKFAAGASNTNTLQGNVIGLDATGAVDPNHAGVRVDTGLAIIKGNVISGNFGDGVELGSSGSFVTGNWIGTDKSGTAQLGNSASGINVKGSNNHIGGTNPGDGNVIAFNQSDGVFVVSGVNNAIQENFIYGNVTLGIASGNDQDVDGNPAPLVNDSSGHMGANNFENYPVLTSVTGTANNLTVTGTLHVDPATLGNTTFTIDFFTNPANDPSGFGQGQTYIGSATVTTDSSGFAPIVFTATNAPAGQLAWSATATDANGNTSEFSPDVTAQVSTQVTNDVGVTVTDGTTSAVPGASTIYTITVANNGADAASNVSVTDLLPAGVTSFTWSGNGHTNVSGPINDTISSLAAGGTVTYTVTATIDPSATGSIVNTVTVNADNDTNANNNTAIDTDTLTPMVDLAVTKVDNKGGSSITPSTGTVVPGSSFTYSIVVTNNGISTATGVVLNDTAPTGETFLSWSGNGHSGTGSISDTIASLAPGQSVTYTVTASVAPSATGSVTNTATASVPVGETETNSNDNSASDTDNLTPQSDISVTKDDGVTSVIPGLTTTYTIVVKNIGTSTATGVNVNDLVPAGETFTNWSGNGHSGMSGAVSDTIATLAPGASVTYTVTALVDPSATGSVTNTVVVSTTSDSNLSNNTATDSDSLTPQNDVSVTKDDGVTSVVPGLSTTYTIVVKNTGPSTATNVAVNDLVPAGETFTSWSGNGHTNVSGVLSDAIASLAPGQTVMYTVTAAISPTATGTVTNVVTVTAANDVNGTNNTATDSDTLTPQVDLAVAKTDGKTSAVPGTSDTYTITVTNNGPGTVSSFTMNDAVPAALLNATFGAPSAGSYNATTGAWSGLSLGTGQSVTITITGTIDPSATGSLTNTVTVGTVGGVTDTNPGNNTASDTDTLNPQNDVGVTKTDGTTTAIPGQSTAYTIVVTNNGPSTATGIVVSDLVPSGETFTSWSGNGNTSVSGSINDTIASLAPGASVTYTVTALISPSATGSVTNTVTVAAAGDSNAANNTASDTDTLSVQDDVAVTKTDGISSVVPGQNTTYTIVVTNNGISTATGVSVTDLVPTGETFTSWSGNGHTNVSGALNDTIASLAPGASVTYTVTAAISSTATGSLTNTVTVSAANDTNVGNNTASDTDTVTQVSTGSITGIVFCDDNINGVYDCNDDLLAGAVVTLTDSSGHVLGTSTTNSNGAYTFSGLAAGTYKLSVTTTAPGHVAELSHGTVTIPSGPISKTITAGQQAAGPNFPEISHGGLSGFIWDDANNDGKIDWNEVGVPNVVVTLNGTDLYGHTISVSMTTDDSGQYVFDNLMPGTYSLSETLPTGITQGKLALGNTGGTIGSSTTINCGSNYNNCSRGYVDCGNYYGCGSSGSCNTPSQQLFSNIPISGCDDFGTGYNFGGTGGSISGGTTATIGFWHNGNGQSLLNSLNGSSHSTALGAWLAGNFPNLYGTGAKVNFVNMTNQQIASYYNLNDFSVSGQKLNAQVLAAAFACYVSSSKLAGGNFAASFGFKVTTDGSGYETINVGSNGAAFNVANNTTISIFQALDATNDDVVNTVLYGGSSSLDNMANTIYSAINQNGDIS